MKRIWITLAAFLLAGFPVAAADAPRVVATIKPVHSLVAGVMEGVGAPILLIKGGSPHAYAFKPSEARALQDAQIVFWIGEGFERFLGAPLKSVAANAVSVELIGAPGLTLLRLRESGAWEGHAHDHGHGDEDHHDDHDGSTVSTHIWLDPLNAKAMVGEIARQLTRLNPDNADTYSENAASLSKRLDALSNELAAVLKPVRGEGFLVFHDAYHNLEHRYGLRALGSLTISPEIQPGAARLSALREKISEAQAVCVFSEPQFTPKLVNVLLEGTTARSGVLDPLGADIKPGTDLYFTLMRRNAESLHSCLSASVRQGQE